MLVWKRKRFRICLGLDCGFGVQLAVRYMPILSLGIPTPCPMLAVTIGPLFLNAWLLPRTGKARARIA